VGIIGYKWNEDGLTYLHVVLRSLSRGAKFRNLLHQHLQLVRKELHQIRNQSSSRCNMYIRVHILKDKSSRWKIIEEHFWLCSDHLCCEEFFSSSIPSNNKCQMQIKKRVTVQNISNEYIFWGFTIVYIHIMIRVL
jgi:hypothetical protein